MDQEEQIPAGQLEETSECRDSSDERPTTSQSPQCEVKLSSITKSPGVGTYVKPSTMDQEEQSPAGQLEEISEDRDSNHERPTTSQSPQCEKKLSSIMKSPGVGVLPEGNKKKRKKLLRFQPRKRPRELEGGTDDPEWEQASPEVLEDELHISEDDAVVSDEDLEKKLEENAAKNNLSAVNVKSIIHHVVSNEQVQALFRKGNEGKGIKLDYEPKLTRSKVKKVVEIEDPVPIPLWPISPMKKSKEGPQFTELPFSEDSESDDEDYDPARDELNKTESDYESIASHPSELGSPFPSTPTLPTALQTPTPALSTPEPPASPAVSVQAHEEVTVETSQGVNPPQGDISQPPAVGTVNAEDILAALTGASNQCFTLTQGKPAGTIAHRTRSKFPIEIPLQEIEANFVAPDVSMDMYDKGIEDLIGRSGWLRCFMTMLMLRTNSLTVHLPIALNVSLDVSETSDGNDDDQNDPEFNYLAEQEKMTTDVEEHRCDRAVRVSRKELEELLTEVMAEYGEGVEEPIPVSSQFLEAPKPMKVSPPVKIKQCLKPSMKQRIKKQAKKRAALEMTEQEKDEVTQQLQQYVQLLTQMYLLTRENPSQQATAIQAKSYVNELNHFANVFEESTESLGCGKLTSCFRVFSLQEALNIVNAPFTVTAPANACHGRIPIPVPVKSAEIMSTSRVFMYPELLPITGFPFKQPRKVFFSKAEDNLLVLGLDQFEDFDHPEALVVEHMLPTKTAQQLKHHIKNSTKKGLSNVIYTDLFDLSNYLKSDDYKNLNKLPKLKRTCRFVKRGKEKAPVYQMMSPKPAWLEKFLKQNPQYNSKRSLAPKERLPDMRQLDNKRALMGPATVGATSNFSLVRLGTAAGGFGSGGPFVTHIVPAPGEAVSLDLSQPQSKLGSQINLRTLDKEPKRPRKLKKSTFPVNPTILPKPPMPGCVITVDPTGRTPFITINGTAYSMGFSGVQPTLTSGPVAAPVTKSGGHKSKSKGSQKLSSKKRSPLKRKGISPGKRIGFPVLNSSPKGSSALRQFKLGKGIRNKYAWSNAQKAKVRKGLKFGSGDSKESPMAAGLPDSDGDFVDVDNNMESDDAADKMELGTTGVSRGSPSVCFMSNPLAESTPVIPQQQQGDLEQLPANETSGGEEHAAGNPSNMEETEVDVTGDDEQERGAADEEGGRPMGGKENVPGIEGQELQKRDTGQGGLSKDNIGPEDSKVSGNGVADGLKFGPKRVKRRKLVTKKMRNKMRRDSEIRKKLTDPQLMETDEQKEGREIAFSKMFLTNAKRIFHATPEKYLKLLHYFQDFTADSKQGLVDLCEKVFTLLEDHPKLILQFTAFLPLSTARELKRLQESLEFVKVRLFLRQVEVYFSKQQTHYHKIINTILEWDEDKLVNAGMLKKNILPLLKGQPQLLQSFLSLFTEEEVKEPGNSRFEVLQLDSKDKQYDSYEEIELTDSEDEQDDPGRIQPLLKSRRLVTEVEDVDPYAKPRINFRRRATASPKGRESDAEESPGEGKKEAAVSSTAVTHLSQMCDNLADYLNENAAATEDEDIEVETELETEVETELDDEAEGDGEGDTEDQEVTSDHLGSGESMDEGEPSPKGQRQDARKSLNSQSCPGSPRARLEGDHHGDDLSSPIGSGQEDKQSKTGDLSDDVINPLSNGSSESFGGGSNENSQDSEYGHLKASRDGSDGQCLPQASEDEEDKTLTCSPRLPKSSDSESDRTILHPRLPKSSDSESDRTILHPRERIPSPNATETYPLQEQHSSELSVRDDRFNEETRNRRNDLNENERDGTAPLQTSSERSAPRREETIFSNHSNSSKERTRNINMNSAKFDSSSKILSPSPPQREKKGSTCCPRA
ncbi:putative GON-4-like protein [Apostichopus japonicus]|uniref:Putative GON-4-like protein n=1 Tax=Stichopus japonicus TaxID=307972 RepID=A0A2G8LMW9_STIJA|nr:putative GON-4-like protein [Apostichopus japonicus]